MNTMICLISKYSSIVKLSFSCIMTPVSSVLLTSMTLPIITAPVMIYSLLGLVLILTILFIRLENRFRKLLQGQNAKSLEGIINELHARVSQLNTFQSESIEYLKNIEARLKRSVQAIETIRFNPFKGTGDGGNQSFVTAFLSEKGDGVVVSSLYTRDRVSVFSKPIKKFISEFELTSEEKEAIKQAKESLSYESKTK